MGKRIVIIGTLDTKGREVAFMKSLIEARGHSALIIDVSPLGPPGVVPDITNEKVAYRAGWELTELLQTGLRDRIMEVMGKGAAGVLLSLYRDGQLDGVIGLGGNQGTAIASMAMKSLPLGIPKFLVSTVASGDMRPYVGHKDIGVMFSVGDLLGGPNPLTRSILANSVSALLGMVEHGEEISLAKGQRTVAISALGNTQAAVELAVKLLQERSFHAIAFHASGAGGSAMEELIESGLITGVLDITPHELAEEVLGVGRYVPVRPGRLTAAGRLGIPQVVSTGALEYLCFGPIESVPGRLRKRRIYMHNPLNANVRVSRSEMVKIGKVMAERLNEAKGPTAVLIPVKGWSIYGKEGGPLHDSRGDQILIRILKQHLRKEIRFEEVDAHINDSHFMEKCIRVLLDLMEEAKR